MMRTRYYNKLLHSIVLTLAAIPCRECSQLRPLLSRNNRSFRVTGRADGSLENVTSRLLIYRAFESVQSAASHRSARKRRTVLKLRNKFSGEARGTERAHGSGTRHGGYESSLNISRERELARTRDWFRDDGTCVTYLRISRARRSSGWGRVLAVVSVYSPFVILSLYLSLSASLPLYANNWF